MGIRLLPLARAARLAAVGLLTAGAIVYARRHPRQVRNLVRSFNKHALNPVLLRFAGRGTFYASVIQHTGRRSGRTYLTPVVADAVEGGFLIPLPYGADADWCLNVLAAGGATLQRHGETFRVIRPEVVDAGLALEKLTIRPQALRRRLMPAQFLMVRPAPAKAGTSGASRKPRPRRAAATAANGLPVDRSSAPGRPRTRRRSREQ